MSILTVTERKALGRYAGNVNWFRANYARLAAKYPNKFVTIENGDAIDSDTDPKRLIERLRDKYGGGRVATFSIESVSKNDVDLII